MSEMGRGSSLVVAEFCYLSSLRELRYWILRFDKDCLSNGVFLMHHVPKSVKHLYIEHHSTKKTAALTVHTVDGEGRRKSNCYSLIMGIILFLAYNLSNTDIYQRIFLILSIASLTVHTVGGEGGRRSNC